MIKPRGGLCLAHEPPAGSVVVGRCGRQQFERHSPVEARIFGEIDVPHASCAKRGLNDVAAEASAGSKRHGALSVAESRRSRARGARGPEVNLRTNTACGATCAVTTPALNQMRCYQISSIMKPRRTSTQSVTSRLRRIPGKGGWTSYKPNRRRWRRGLCQARRRTPFSSLSELGRIYSRPQRLHDVDARRSRGRHQRGEDRRGHENASPRRRSAARPACCTSVNVAADEPRQREPADDAGDDARAGDHRAFAEDAASAGAAAPIRSPGGCRTRASARSPRTPARRRRRRPQSVSATPAKPPNTSAFSRSGASTSARTSSSVAGLLHRLLGRQLADDARDRRHQRVRIGLRVDEQPAAANLLLERVIHASSPAPARRSRRRRRRRRRRCGAASVLTPMNFITGSVHIRWRLTRVLVREHPLRQALADDHDRLGVAPIGVGEVAAGDDRHAERREESRRHRAEPRARILFAVGLARSPRPRTGSRDRTCRRRATARRVPTATRSTPGSSRDAPHRFLVERGDLLRRAASYEIDRHVAARARCAS